MAYLSSENTPVPNYSMFSNKRFDLLYNNLKGPFRRGDRSYSLKKSITELNKILEEECPWIPIGNDILWTIMDKKLKNFHFNPYNRSLKNLFFSEKIKC